MRESKRLGHSHEIIIHKLDDVKKPITLCVFFVLMQDNKTEKNPKESQHA